MKKFWQFLIVAIFAFAVVGCGGSGDNGGGNDNGGNDDGGNDTGLTCAHDSTQAKCADPETWDWQYNRSEFNGKGMTIKLLHGAPEEVNPNLAEFSGERKNEKLAQLVDIQDAYHITLSIEKFPDEAAWGPDRVAWINGLAANNETTKGDIFAISSDWIPTLVTGKSIALLETLEFNDDSQKYEQKGGMFTDLGYEQNQIVLELTSFQKKAYGYFTSSAHANFFLYYNQDLITDYELEDPATLWNEGKWDWTTFYNFLETAQNAFDSRKPEGDPQKYAFGGWITEVVRGALAARGGKFVDPTAKQVLFKNAKVVAMYNDLRNIKAAGMWATETGDVCPQFVAGNQLFQPAQLWFLSSTMRFASADPENPTCDFQISVVPYPTADGDAAAKSEFTVPMGADSGYAIRNIQNEASGLTAKILLNILDDFCRGLAPEFSAEDLTEEEAYRNFLNERIDSAASVEAVMSVENNIKKYGYTDYLDVVSKSVGNGSDWQGDGFYTWGLKLLNDEVDVATELAAHYDNYQRALDEILVY